MVFCFGSNLLGIHAGGAARFAFEKHGAEWGKGEGLAGNSYALPTVTKIGADPMTEVQLELHVNKFLQFAREHPQISFQVTRVGCGLAGHKDEDMAKLFLKASANCFFDSVWQPFLGIRHHYWGTV